jgi:2-polyprenyl-6-methoxyphenol hydroxylase-like FAD-dependent oxidoreductase
MKSSVIIGGGPVGLATALVLAKLGYKDITVYEGRDIPNAIE